MKNGKFIEFITSVPFIMGAIFVVTLAIFWIFIMSYQNYTLNSSVLTKDSYLKLDKKGKLEFFINANLFPEIKKESTFQNQISEEQLQKALLKKELKLLEEYDKNPHNAQNLFDLGIWYLYTSGVRSNLSQLVEDRGNRLLASYYYFKKFLLIDSKEKAVSELAKEINSYIDNEAKNNIEFYNSLTIKLERDFDKPLTEQEEEQNDLIEYVIEEKEGASREEKIKNLEELCKYYEKNIETYSKSRKLGFETATLYCYTDLSRYSDNFISQTNKYKKKVSSFDYAND